MKWSGFAGVAVEDTGTVTSLDSHGAATGEEGRAKDGFPARVLGRRDHRRDRNRRKFDYTGVCSGFVLTALGVVLNVLCGRRTSRPGRAKGDATND